MIFYNKVVLYNGPYRTKFLLLSYKFDKETIKLLGIANDKYGQYKSLLKMFKFDQKFFS